MQHAPVRLLDKALVVFVGVLLLSLLIIFALEPSIYTTALWPGWRPTERYPWQILLFLLALLVFLSMLIYGIIQHWRWLFWLILIAFTGAVIQIPLESLQLLGVLPNPYPIWYSLFRGAVGFIQLGFAFWMFQTYRHYGVWATGRNKEKRISQLAYTKYGVIEYRSVGQGPGVLLLNGGHTNCHSPLGDEQFFLKRGYQLIIPSRPGYGKTPSITGKQAETFADALVSLLDQLHLDQVIVVGISAAGPTALQLAGRAPERVRKLILESAQTGSTFATGRTRLLTYIFFNPVVERWFWAAYRFYGHRDPQGALKMMMKSLSSLPIDQVMASMTQPQQQAALALLLASRSGSGFLHDIRHHCGDLSRITAPTLIIHSQYDGAVGLSHATWAYERVPHAELFVSKAESHLLWFSAAYEEMKTRMQTFLQS